MPARALESTLRLIVGWSRRAPHVVGLIGLAPQGSHEDAERALSAGFDDFVTGEISARELSGRIRALARRIAGMPARTPERIRWGTLVVDIARHLAEVGDRRVSLTPREMRLLTTLIEAGGRTLTRDQLLERVWGVGGLDVETRAVDSLISRLRQKLGHANILVTVRGVGFRAGDP